MKNQNTGDLSTGSVNRALHSMMKQEGMIFPETLEDIEVMDAKVDTAGTPTPDVNRFRRFLRGKEVIQSRKSAKVVAFQDANITEKLAMAARNGKPIPADIRKRMTEDREGTEKLRSKTTKDAADRT